VCSLAETKPCARCHRWMRIVTRSSRASTYPTYSYVRYSARGGWWLWLVVVKRDLLVFLDHDNTPYGRRRTPNSPPKPWWTMNIGARKFGDSPNHAQQVDAPCGCSRPV
jgi:hypothetical protein